MDETLRKPNLESFATLLSAMDATASPLTSSSAATATSARVATAPVMLFDGVCNVCNAAVQFVLSHERAPEYQFASLQSELGKRMLDERGLTHDLDTVVVVDGERIFTRSSAAVHVLRSMRGAWPVLAALLWIVPKPLRDLGYDVFAHFRYRFFGKRDSCMIPTPELRSRFVG
jgi:predicted DCC family thiol-disulfide oxidoreductase YuxK